MKILLMAVLILFTLKSSCEGPDGQTGPTGVGLPGATGIGEPGATGIGEPGAPGPTGTNGPCVNSHPPVITKVVCNNVDGCNNMLLVDHTYTFRIVVEDSGGTEGLTYDIVGTGGYLTPNPLNQSLWEFTPNMTGGPLTFTALVSDGCQMAMKEFVIDSVEVEGWSYVGDRNGISPAERGLSFGGNNGNLFLAVLLCGSSFSPVQVFTYRHGEWIYAGNQGPASITEVDSSEGLFSFGVNKDSVPYFANYNGTSQKAEVTRLNGHNDWERAGSDFSFGQPTMRPWPLAFDSNGTPYLAGQLDPATAGVVKLDDDNQWVLSGPLIPDPNVKFWSIAIDPSGTLYAALNQTTGVQVVKLNGANAWEYVGQEISSDENISLAITPNGTLFMATTIISTGTVFWLNGSSQWESIGPDIENLNYGFQMALSADGIPYVAYVVMEPSYYFLFVKKYINGEWVDLSWRYITRRAYIDSEGKSYQLIVDKNVPYVAFMQDTDESSAPPDQLVVMKYIEGPP